MPVTTTEQKTKRREYMRAYRAMQHSKNDAFMETLLQLLEQGKDVIVELVRAANSNPLLGIFISIVATDILARSKIIDPSTAAGLYVAIGAIEGASVAGTIISDFTDVFKLFSKSPTQDLVRPSATTIVYPRAGQNEDLQTRVGSNA